MNKSYFSELKNFESEQFNHNSEYLRKNLKDLITCLSLINSFANMSDQKINTNKKTIKQDPKKCLIEFKKSDPLYDFARAEIKYKLNILYDLRDNNEEAVFELDAVNIRSKLNKEIKNLKRMIIDAKFEDKPFSEQRIEIVSFIKKLSKKVIGIPIKLSYYMRKTVIELFMENSNDNIIRNKYSLAMFSLAQMGGIEIYLSEFIRRYQQSNITNIILCLPYLIYNRSSIKGLSHTE